MGISGPARTLSGSIVRLKMGHYRLGRFFLSSLSAAWVAEMDSKQDHGDTVGS